MLNILMKRIKCISIVPLFVFIFTGCLLAETTTEKQTRLRIGAFQDASCI